MSTPSVLIVYGSRYGQTAKVARYIGDLLATSGFAATVASIDSMPQHIAPAAFDVIIVGSPIYFSRHLPAVRRFVLTYRDALNAAHSAFFSVSGSAGSRNEADRADAQRCLSQFLEQTRWHPALSETFGGSMAYTKYNPLVRWVIRRISKRRGGPVDTSRDHEVTDWTRVRRFVDAVSSLVDRSAAVGSCDAST